jgi:hypothetical protein
LASDESVVKLKRTPADDQAYDVANGFRLRKRDHHHDDDDGVSGSKTVRQHKRNIVARPNDIPNIFRLGK